MVTLVAAVARNRVIGVEGKLPWRLPEDLRRFRSLTLGGVVIMGRKTFDSIGRPLDGRDNVVLTRNPEFRADGVQVARSPSEALDLATTAPRAPGGVYVIGGADLYRAFLAAADVIELTLVDAAPDGDTYFPPIGDGWTCSRHEPVPGTTPFGFHTLIRGAGSPGACIAPLVAGPGERDPQDEVIAL